MRIAAVALLVTLSLPAFASGGGAGSLPDPAAVAVLMCGAISLFARRKR